MVTRLSKVIIAASLLSAGIVGGQPLSAAPPSGGTIAIEAVSAPGDRDSVTRPFVDAAGEALASKGFTILEDKGHAAYVAELILTRVDVGTGSAKASSGNSSVTPGSSAGVGVGATIPLPTGKSRLVALQRIQIEMRIRKRGEDALVWHGSAVTVREAGTREGANGLVAPALSEAMLRSYPAEVQEVVGVP